MYTYEKSKEHNIYPGLVVYDRLSDGDPAGWKVEAAPGYVMYRTDAGDKEIDPETGEEIAVTYYYESVILTRYFNWDNLTWVAVPRDKVDENHIF